PRPPSRAQATLAPLMVDVGRQVEALCEALRPLADAFKGLAEAGPRVAQAESRAIKYLLERGWSFTYSFTDRLLVAIDDLMLAGEHDAAEALMVEFAR